MWLFLTGGDRIRLSFARPSKSDNFEKLALGTKWSFRLRPNEAKRASISGNTLTLAANGSAPVNSSPL